MMKHRLFGVILAVGLVSASCGNDADDAIVENPNGAVMLMLNPDVKSRMSVNGNATEFEGGDKIKVSSAGLIDDMDGAILVVDSDGKTLKPEGGKEYYYNGNAKAEFFACYPVEAVFSGTESVTFTVANDQSFKDAHVANDFMTAQCTGEAAFKVTLSFTHMLAWVKVEIVNADEISDVVIKNILPKATHTFSGTEANVDVPTNENIDVKMGKQGGGGGFEALIPQQEIKANTDLLDITVDELTYTYAPTSDIKFAAGKIKTIKLKIANNVIIEDGISVVGWNDGEVIEGNIIKKQQ